MSYTWVGAGINCNYWQGPAEDMGKVPTPRNGDTYLNVTDQVLYTYQDGWMPING